MRYALQDVDARAARTTLALLGCLTLETWLSGSGAKRGRAKWGRAKWDRTKWGRAKWDRAKWGKGSARTAQPLLNCLGHARAYKNLSVTARTHG